MAIVVACAAMMAFVAQRCTAVDSAALQRVDGVKSRCTAACSVSLQLCEQRFGFKLALLMAC